MQEEQRVSEPLITAVSMAYQIWDVILAFLVGRVMSCPVKGRFLCRYRGRPKKDLRQALDAAPPLYFVMYLEREEM